MTEVHDGGVIRFYAIQQEVCEHMHGCNFIERILHGRVSHAVQLLHTVDTLHDQKLNEAIDRYQPLDTEVLLLTPAVARESAYSYNLEILFAGLSALIVELAASEGEWVIYG